MRTALGRSLEKLGREQEANGHYKLARLLEARQRAIRRAHQTSDNRCVRAVVQRVSEARVRVDGDVVGEIGQGLYVLLGVSREDGEDERAVRRQGGEARIFENEDGEFDRSLLDVRGRGARRQPVH